MADRQNGNPIPLRLVCPDDTVGARSVKMLETLEVVGLKKMIRLFAMLLAGCGLAMPQSPVVVMRNLSRPAADFQVGDHFEIIVSAAPHQAISVRTARMSKTDWGPVIASTDASGQWSAKGSFEKKDYGSWSEVWTVGGKVANPVVSFDVRAPCTEGGKAFLSASGPNRMETCDTAAGQQQSFVTPSDGDSFRTPDGRVIPGSSRSNMTPETYRMGIMESIVTGNAPVEPGKRMQHAGELIGKLIGVNELTEAETRKVLGIVRAVGVPETEKTATLALLRQLAAGAESQGLKDDVAGTIEFAQRQ
ncbi:MAG TPA: hypothetical protein VGM43_05645 [Bryobacteraceae bacterium]